MSGCVIPGIMFGINSHASGLLRSWLHGPCVSLHRGPCSQDHMQNQESASSNEGGILGQEFIDVEV